MGGAALEQALPERVDALPLLVHHLVVFEQVFPDVEVAFLNLFLSAFDAPADHLALDRFAFLHSQPGEHRRHPLPREFPHQVVFERQEEPRRARISLPACAAAKLVVDPPALVPLRADDVQSPGAATSRPSAFISGS